MKKSTFNFLLRFLGLKLALLTFTSSVLLTGLHAQTPASATWSLLTDQTAVTTGNITAANQTLGPLLTGIQYNQNYGSAPSVSSGWQRVATTSGIKTGSDSAVTNGGYVEYKVTPTPGNYLRIDTVRLEVMGGGTGTARLAAYYSLDNFATSDSFGVTTTYNATSTRATRKDSVVLINGGSGTPALTGQQILRFVRPINVNPGQTFSVRFYVWLTGYSATVRHLGEKNVVIAGVTSATPLPVKFTNVKAFQKLNGVQVEWSDATSTIDRYVIERSGDGRVFTEVASIAGSNQTGLVNYTWFDAAPVNGNNFYRIKGIEKDGNATFTSILRVGLSKVSQDVVIAPNPVKGRALNLQLTNLNKGAYALSIFNNSGQQVYTKSIIHEGGSATQLLQLPAAIKSGVYNMQLSSGEVKFNKSIMVE